MAYSTVVKRSTAMPDSDQAENNRLTALAAKAWVLSAFAGANATQVSNTAIAVFLNGTIVRIVASGGTANALVGTVTTNTTGIFVPTVAEGGTLGFAFGTPGTAAAVGYPTVPASQIGLAAILVCATATAFNGGTNSLADAAYTVSIYNFTGPAAIALTTEAWTNVPG